MSLTVSPELLDQAHQDQVDDQAFVDCVRQSLPYAWTVISELAEQANASGAEYEANETPPPGESERGQLLRALASDAMRGALERHFGMRIAFQNCHRVALFRPEARSAYADFVTPRAQLLNQSPELVDC
ncbi:SCO5389 family protein [Lipingzhangella sp. LS1_29]|uniref:SCO5389 family protein n=1 Tax=Lipingzhangella rawalii TaxID=2055835 RepID=A0ABU2H5B7_9ACTN|nr:SCO5389 family protein [Lipingzhangella rawalii]MDS1270483.1 SCO5389 family protein [Lipingzhangella rawalii]